MLIRNAEIDFCRVTDIRIEDGLIRAVDKDLPNEGETLDAEGNAVIPGLHDHHIHLLAYAASLDSVPCGPPQIGDAAALQDALQGAARNGGWIRGVGYHDSVAGAIDRAWLDRVVTDVPVRIQHRSGRLWILNSAALDRLGPIEDSPLERSAGVPTGRLYDSDGWLRSRLGSQLPDLARAGRHLLARGVTGLTDTSPGNGPAELTIFRTAQDQGALPQDLLVMGSAALNGAESRPGLAIGPTKFHLHDADLPPLESLADAVVASHAAGRAAAFHCVTLAELILALAALDMAGSHPGDRIEHAAIAPPDLLPQIAALGATVVTQPNFIAERGDAYLRDVEPADQPWLYRLAGFAQAGIPLAAGTDAPFGTADPWFAMQAAVDRMSDGGVAAGIGEALTPEAALGLFLAPLDAPGGTPRRLRAGAPADLCVLDRPWRDARANLARVGLRATVKGGHIVWRGA